MSRRLLNLAAIAAFLVLGFGSLSAIKAQENVTLQGGSPAMNYSRELLKRVDVQNELELDANQKAALAKVLSAHPRIVVRPVITHRDISSLSDAERKQWNAEIGRQAAKQAAYVMNERRREVEEILRPDQRQRLTEIDLQWRGVLALGNKSLSDRLGISADRHQRIAQILADFEVKRLSLLSASEKSEDTDSPRYQKRRVLLQATEQKVFALLSAEEKGRWAEAIGKPFKFEGMKSKEPTRPRGRYF